LLVLGGSFMKDHFFQQAREVIAPSLPVM
jgi:hypothetical protein